MFPSADPPHEPLSERYKALFSDCDRAYPGDRAWRTQCRITAKTWRIGLETPISTTYWERSQAWGRANCELAPAPAN